jgi:hypothetical protein
MSFETLSPPRGESVDSISVLSFPDHRPVGRPLVDSPKPADGTSGAVVKFPYSASRRVHSRKPRRSRAEIVEAHASYLASVTESETPRERRQRERREAPAETVTAANGRLRDARKDAWNAAEAATRYWDVTRKFIDAVDMAQRHGVIEGHNHKQRSPQERQGLVDLYRQALVEQLLTPAPDLRAVAWKQSVVDRDDYVFWGARGGPAEAGTIRYIKKERVERAIAEDQAFLAAHPVRRNKAVQS